VNKNKELQEGRTGSDVMIKAVGVSQSLFKPQCDPLINDYCRRYGTLSRAWAFPKTRGFAVSPQPSAGIASTLSTTRPPATVCSYPFFPFTAHSPYLRRRERVPRARA
jgi:hypothetical protein